MVARARRRPLPPGAAILVALLSEGCSAAYWTDRARDGLDVVTVAGEAWVIGGVCQAGPLEAGLFLPMESSPGSLFGSHRGAGVRGGRLGTYRATQAVAWVWHLDEFLRPGTDERMKNWMHSGIFPGIGWDSFSSSDAPPFYTQLEAAAGLGLGIRAGINPGEILDLLLGFATVDLHGDDIEWKARRLREHEAQAPPP